MTKSYSDNDELFEEFAWADLKLNQKLVDNDFDPKNEKYKF